MSVIDLESLLGEISPENPTGEDLEYDAAFVAMFQAAQGKPEQQMGDSIVPAEEPNWREVKKQALELLTRSKDLRVGVVLARALLVTDGFQGLADGLDLIKGLIERHWDHVHPRLDPEDDNDPTMRVNTLVSLCDPATTLKGVRETPLVSSRALGRFGLRDILIATGKLPAPAGESAPPEGATIDAAFMECDLEELQATTDAVGRAIELAAAVEVSLTEKVGAAQAADLSALADELKHAHKTLADHLSRRGVETGGEAAEQGAATQSGGAAAPMSGAITSRADVVRVLDKICDYFAQNEPSSPVPLLLQRAKRLVSKSFVEIVQDLAPDGISQVDTIRGASSEES